MVGSEIPEVPAIPSKYYFLCGKNYKKSLARVPHREDRGRSRAKNYSPNYHSLWLLSGRFGKRSSNRKPDFETAVRPAGTDRQCGLGAFEISVRL